MARAETIGQVIEQLDQIIEWSLQEGSRLGYFPAIYRLVTLEVQKGIEEGFFEDGQRMERLDVAFANRYLNAFYSHRKKRAYARSWRTAFQADEDGGLLILQHLLLGINAHINLDLGIATAEVAPGARIKSLKGDFEKINTILIRLMAQVQRSIDELSPWIAFLDRIGKRADDKFADFSLRTARRAAWKVAKDLSELNSQQRREMLRVLDGTVAALGGLVRGKSWHTKALIWIIRRRESKDVRHNIEVLRGGFGDKLGGVLDPH